MLAVRRLFYSILHISNMILKVEIIHQIGDIVFLKTDPEQNERMVTEIRIRQNSVLYSLSCGTTDSLHYEIEISTQKKY